MLRNQNGRNMILQVDPRDRHTVWMGPRLQQLVRQLVRGTEFWVLLDLVLWGRAGGVGLEFRTIPHTSRNMLAGTTVMVRARR